MARGITSALNTEFTASALQPFLAVRLDFLGGTFLTWTGLKDITIDGESYIGSGEILGFSPISETGEVQANGVVISLNGIDSDLVSAALTDTYQGRSAKVYLGAMDSSGDVVADPYLLFSGRMDTMAIDDDGEQATVKITCESRLIDLNRNRVRRFTNEDQQLEFPGDVGLEFVSSLQDKSIRWGR